MPFPYTRFRKQALLTVGGALVLLVAVLLANTLRFAAPLYRVVDERVPTALPVAAVEHLQQAIRWQTVSSPDSGQVDTSQFAGLRKLLQQAYPLLHRQLTRELVGGASHTAGWRGSDTTLAPVIVLAHQDVVPVEPEALAGWHVPPFAGVVRAGFVWGRGATDNKANLIAICEAIEQALHQGYSPRRTVYFAFGHDEEVGGGHGAARMAELLRRRHGRAAFVLDEGGFITTQRVPGLVGRPVALIGTAEKGYLSVELSAALPGGHSSLPAKETAIELVAQALITLRAHPFKPAFTPAMNAFAAHVGPHLPFPQRLAFANKWLLEPLILRAYTQSPGGNAAVRTTMVPTTIRAGIRANVVPSLAVATINLRLLPGMSPRAALAQLRTLLPDARLQLRTVGFVSVPGPTSADTSRYFHQLEYLVRRLVPGAITTPFLMTGITDARHFSALTPNIYRFSLMTDPVGLHGEDERLSVASFSHCIRFYADLLHVL
jgi:carboxypeptidase PM20D1